MADGAVARATPSWLGVRPRGLGKPSWLGLRPRDTTIDRRAAVAAEKQRRVWSLERCSRVAKSTFLALIWRLRERGEDET